MEVLISSDMTMGGTTVTVDGKKLKNIKMVDFDVYEKTEWAEGPGGMMTPTGETPCVKLTVHTEEDDEDGTEKEVHYHYCKEGDGEGVLDRKIVTVPEGAIVDELASKMMGRNSKL